MGRRCASVCDHAVLPHEVAWRCPEMMDAMIAYSAGMLDAVAVFLSSEPIIYLVGLVCLAFVVKVVKDIIK